MIDAAADVEEDGAPLPRDGGMFVVPDLDEPMVGEVAGFHFFAAEPWREVGGIGDDVLVVMGGAGIIDPCVEVGDLMVGVVAAGREGGLVAVDLAELKDAGGGTFVALDFVETELVLAGDAAPPCEAGSAEEDGPWLGYGTPWAAGIALVEAEEAVVCVPIGGDGDDQLGGGGVDAGGGASGIGGTGGTGGSDGEDGGGDGEEDEAEGHGGKVHAAGARGKELGGRMGLMVLGCRSLAGLA